MVGTLLEAYLAAAIISAIVVFIVSGRVGEERRPTPERIGLSSAAGAIWPVILLGLVELSSVAVYAKVYEHDDEDPRVEVLV